MPLVHRTRRRILFETVSWTMFRSIQHLRSPRPLLLLPHSLNSQWFDATNLLACEVKNGQRRYLVKWSDESIPPSWQLDRDITDALKHEYHITRTLKGTRRKRATSLTDV